MPIKEKVKGLVHKEVRLLLSKEEGQELLGKYQKRNAKAKVRLLTELLEETCIPYSLVTGKLNIATSTLKSMQAEDVIVVEEEGYYRQVFKDCLSLEKDIEKEVPNEEQNHIISKVISDYKNGENQTYLLKGVTGSGKTLVYIEIIEQILAMGKEAIVLIPEIALTYQTVKRFRKRFGDKVTIMNSRLSKGEKYDQFERAKNGEVSVIIGPRSALFTPFQNLGVIIIDEEHEPTYKSDYAPKYHAREIAIERARMSGATVILGSATPSVESYHRAMIRKYQLLTLEKRAVEGAELATVSVVDLRQELKEGNRSIFSRHLQSLIEERLNKKQQVMLFLNRRGFAGFVSCRSCGHVFKCPHCDVSLTEHFSNTPKERLVCHYCGYEIRKTKECPECQSKYIAGFGIGTQKVEEQVKQLFPQAKVLRMDMDTTKNKDSHESILSQFANGEADILVGTQMIVKGHDFSNVTLVGVIAADLTLFDNDYKSAERTFDLLTQAAGRAGRGNLKGEVVIQTYNPEHYCIDAAAKQDYEAFFEEEKAYRSLLEYPPFCHVLAIFMEHSSYDTLVQLSDELKNQLLKWQTFKDLEQNDRIRIIGPSDATIVKVNDRYRRVVYLKQKNNDRLIEAKNVIEGYLEKQTEWKNVYVTYDFDPIHGY